MGYPSNQFIETVQNVRLSLKLLCKKGLRNNKFPEKAEIPLEGPQIRKMIETKFRLCRPVIILNAFPEIYGQYSVSSVSGLVDDIFCWSPQKIL